MTTDSETTEQYLTFVWSRFLISVLVFVSRDFELGRVSVQFMLLQLQLYLLGGGGVQSRPSDPYGLIFIIIKNEKIRVTLCENTAGALYIVNGSGYL